jgi:hypothetical protein
VAASIDTLHDGGEHVGSRDAIAQRPQFRHLARAPLSALRAHVHKDAGSWSCAVCTPGPVHMPPGNDSEVTRECAASIDTLHDGGEHVGSGDATAQRPQFPLSALWAHVHKDAGSWSCAVCTPGPVHMPPGNDSEITRECAASIFTAEECVLVGVTLRP